MDASLLVLYVIASFLALKSLLSLMTNHRHRFLQERIDEERAEQQRNRRAAVAGDAPEELAA